MMNYLLMISGKNGSGKTTMANYLAEKYSTKTLTIVKQLKEMFCNIHNITQEQLEKYKNFFRYEWSMSELKKVDINIFKHFENENFDDEWSELPLDYKNQGLVEISTDMKNIHGDDYWVNRFTLENKELLQNESKNLVIDDWRKIIEEKILNKFTQKKVITIRIEPNLDRLVKDGYKLSDDSLETELDKHSFNYTVENTSTLEQFYKNIDDVLIHLHMRKING